MILGLIQTSPLFGDKAGNRKQIEDLISDARADLWVMPELALTGYEFKNREELRELAEEIPQGESCQWLTAFCRERNCHAVMGLAEGEGERVFNSAVLAGPKGILGKYRKLHLFDAETERFDLGDTPYPVFDIGTARVGLMICWDWRYPEAARTLTLRGAQIIAHPSNLVTPYCQPAMVTRALENRVFTATANRVGTETRAGREVRFTGESVIVSPDGVVLARLSPDRAECIAVEIDPAQADDKRTGLYNDLIRERRPEFYVNTAERSPT